MISIIGLQKKKKFNFFFKVITINTMVDKPIAITSLNIAYGLDSTEDR